MNHASNQVEIIASLADLLRGGAYTGNVGKLDSIVLVGHSFGSFTSNSVINKYPSRIDAAVLTGIGFAPLPDYAGRQLLQAFGPRIATGLPAYHAANLESGYLTFGDLYAHVNIFFKAPAYEVDAVRYAHSIVAPFAISEYLSIALSPPQLPAFEGPVLVTTGEFDAAVCVGECYSTYAQQPLKLAFAKSKKVEAYVHLGVGHGINYGKNATGFCREIMGFLERSGF